MERTQVLDLMGTLKLYGMRSAYDEIMATAIKRQHEPPRVVGDLLSAEIAECQSARKVDPGSASNIDPLCRAQTGSARPGEAGRGCAARSGADDWPFRL